MDKNSSTFPLLITGEERNGNEKETELFKNSSTSDDDDNDNLRSILILGSNEIIVRAPENDL